MLARVAINAAQANALDEYGFRTVIAPSFADIFFNNSFKRFSTINRIKLY